MASRKGVKQVGSSRRSLALGDADPRPRRGGETTGAPQSFKPPLVIDRDGKLGVDEAWLEAKFVQWASARGLI